MDITSSLGSFNLNQQTNINTKNNKKNNNKKKEIYYMDIDVEKGMCQGVYFRKNVAMKCNNQAKYLKDGIFTVCENHKNQKFGY